MELKTDSLSALRETLERTLDESTVQSDIGFDDFAFRYFREGIVELLVPPIAAALEQQRDLGDMTSSVAYYARLVDEKDAQIAALHRLLNYALNGWGAHARKDMEHEEIGRIRREALRETPAPPQAQETKFRTAEARKGDN